MYSHVVRTFEGLLTIRAHQAHQSFLRCFDSALDHHISTCYMRLAANRWFTLRVDAIILVFYTITGFLILLIHQCEYQCELCKLCKVQRRMGKLCVNIRCIEYLTSVSDVRALDLGLVGLSLVYCMTNMRLFQRSSKQAAELQMQVLL